MLESRRRPRRLRHAAQKRLQTANIAAQSLCRAQRRCAVLCEPFTRFVRDCVEDGKDSRHQVYT